MKEPDSFKSWFDSLPTIGKILVVLTCIYLQCIVCVVWYVIAFRAAACSGFEANPAPPELFSPAEHDRP